MRWNLKKPRTGLNLSYHFPWSSQMLAVLLWIAKPVWQYCLPFSKLPFFSKKSAKKQLFLCTFSTTKKKTRQIVKRLFLAPKERSFILQSPHPGLFSCVFQSKTIQAESWRQNILQYILLFCSKKRKTRFAQVFKFQKKYIFFGTFLFSLYCSLGPRFAFKKKVVVKVVGLSLKFRKKENPRFI